MASRFFSSNDLKAFDKMAKDNIREALRSKVDQWIETGIIESGSREITFSEHVENEVGIAVNNINNKYSKNNFEGTITALVDQKVNEVILGYEHQIKQEVDAVASSIIQQKVSETLTTTFTNLMKANNNLTIN